MSDFKRLLIWLRGMKIGIALGSAFELETRLVIVEDLNWFPKETIDSILSKTREEQKMLSAFMNKL